MIAPTAEELRQELAGTMNIGTASLILRLSESRRGEELLDVVISAAEDVMDRFFGCPAS